MNEVENEINIEQEWKVLDRRCGKYGISVSDFLKIYDSQQGKCAICQKEIEIFGKGKSAIDHCHKTNEIRGLLCTNCNLVLGRTEAIGDVVGYLTKQSLGIYKRPKLQCRGKGRNISRAMTSAERKRKHRALKKSQNINTQSP